MHFLFMARAYPSFKDDLDEALEDNQVGAVGKAMLKNIKFLCEFAIPTVRTHDAKTIASFQLVLLLYIRYPILVRLWTLFVKKYVKVWIEAATVLLQLWFGMLFLIT